MYCTYKIIYIRHNAHNFILLSIIFILIVLLCSSYQFLIIYHIFLLISSVLKIILPQRLWLHYNILSNIYKQLKLIEYFMIFKEKIIVCIFYEIKKKK